MKKEKIMNNLGRLMYANKHSFGGGFFGLLFFPMSLASWNFYGMAFSLFLIFFIITDGSFLALMKNKKLKYAKYFVLFFLFSVLVICLLNVFKVGNEGVFLSLAFLSLINNVVSCLYMSKLTNS